MNPTDTEMMDWMERNEITMNRYQSTATERERASVRVWNKVGDILQSAPYGGPTIRLAIAAAMQSERPLPGSYSSADRNGPKASGPSIDPSAWQARGWSPIPAAAGAAPGGIDPEDDPWDGLTPADKG